MLNLNYLLLTVLQDKTTKEKAFEELHDFIKMNDQKINNEKELKNWLQKSKKEALKNCCFVDDYQVFTNTAVLYGTKQHIADIKAVKDYPNCEPLLKVNNFSGGVKFNLKALYNASQIIKNDRKTDLTLEFADHKQTYNIQVIEDAYKISGIKEATLKVNLDKEAFIYLYTDTKMLIITPIRQEEAKTDFYVLDNGEISAQKSDKLLKIKVEAKKQEKEAVKVIAKVKGIKETAKTEEATQRQINYLIMLTGKQPKEHLTKNEASKLITEAKRNRAVAQA